MTDQERERELKKVAEWKRDREEKERKAQEYKEEYYRKLRSGEVNQYNEEYRQKEVYRQTQWDKRKTAHPDTMDKSSATLLLIVGMLASLIFKQWYLIWIILLWWYFRTERV